MKINPYYKKIKRSFLLQINCGQCKEPFALYQKVGRGNVLRMHVERIIKSAIDLKSLPQGFYCPYCGQHIADKIQLKDHNIPSYRMVRSSFNTEEIHQ